MGSNYTHSASWDRKERVKSVEIVLANPINPLSFGKKNEAALSGQQLRSLFTCHSQCFAGAIASNPHRPHLPGLRSCRQQIYQQKPEMQKNKDTITHNEPQNMEVTRQERGSRWQMATLISWVKKEHWAAAFSRPRLQSRTSYWRLCLSPLKVIGEINCRSPLLPLITPNGVK